MSEPDWKCPHCGSDKGTWFSRVEPMGNFCESCGKCCDAGCDSAGEPLTTPIETIPCKEYLDKLPVTSEHIWNADIHGIPFGDCKKCGLPIEEWNKKMMELVSFWKMKENI